MLLSVNAWLIVSSVLQTASIKLSSSNQYQLFNFTWVIINQAGDVVNSSSTIGNQPSWPQLEVDLCVLALGASDDWGTPSNFWPQNQPVNAPDPNYNGNLAGCNSYIKRATLADLADGLYVCPSSTHRDRSQDYKCGHSAEFFCASWGCETTGDAYWKPSSSWDYITLRRKFLPKYLQDKLGITTPEPPKTQCQNAWCVPLVISFTENGKNKDWTTRGFTWGLRQRKCTPLTIDCSDPGMTFTIKLLKTIPNKNVAAIGPNPALHHPAKSKNNVPVPKPTITSDSSILPSRNMTTLYQPTVPPGPPDSSKLIVALINASLEAIRGKNSTAYQECWVCFSPTPPFYEGIATFDPPLFTNDTQLLLQAHEPTTALTLATISGLGLCLLGPAMIPPENLIPVCNQTIIINNTFSYLLAANGTYFACSSGLSPYLFTSQFLHSRDYCAVVVLLPHFFIHDSDSFLNFVDRGTSLRTKREPLTAITLSVILGISAIGAGTGIASLVTSNNQYIHLQSLIDKDLNNLREGIQDLKDSVASLSEVVLQNRRGLDLVFLKEGGLCVALREECCFYSDKTGLVQNSLDKVKKSLEERKKAREQQESWYRNWFSASPWLTTLLPSLLGPLVGILLLLSFGPWAFNRLTTFIKNQVDSVIKGPVAVHYHRLSLQEPTEDCVQLPPTTAEGLRFSSLAAEINLPWYSRLWQRLQSLALSLRGRHDN